MPEFKPYAKTPRLFRDIVITEKIDGTNAGIQIVRYPDDTPLDAIAAPADKLVSVPTGVFTVTAQSRKRIITPEMDNFGFARWVHDNAEDLATVLGEGTHYGEWFGRGIQSGYGLHEKFFALFNVARWHDVEQAGVWGLTVVPTLYTGVFNEEIILGLVDVLRADGSVMVHGAKAEGVVIFHSASGQVYKVLCENDELPKGLVDGD